jgi:hypothetical protein
LIIILEDFVNVKTKRIYYLPGSISLLFLFLLCTIWINNNKRAKQRINERALECVYLENDMVDEIPLRIFKTYSLTDSKDLVKIKTAINRLISSKDTVLGVDITISDSCKYLNFVSIFDHFLRKDYDYFYPYGSHIKVIYSDKKSETKSYIYSRRFSCGNVLQKFIIVDKRNLFVKFKEKLINKFIGFWRLDYHLRIVSLSLIIFVLISLKSLFKNNWR